MADQEKAVEALNRALNNHVVAMQAAWIEWQRGDGAEAAMTWIDNTLDGPGLIPADDEPYADDAQLYFNANRSDPYPPCAICMRPSHIQDRHGAYCSHEHCDQAQAQREATDG